ncbi:glutathione S-transferase family protein [Pseudoalteromonas prydzensis]|uniref:glutathione S-transferase family protein n=1 Tax=Pseudoalteromonas prydzensis TaxID=182141 RepID=UPI0007E506B4|nr:glutathione S-transferase family protein [Pseudoalteromonas prydzensis]MBE0379817.1 glutathione S-transferase [Pseudoalteromonas prydzensis ACAM 620]
MYKLYYYPLNASMAPHFILEELQTDFELILVDRKNEAHKAASYLSLNPAGRIPTLLDGQQVVFESAAICIHLAEAHPAKMLIPQIGEHNRAACLQWMMYLTNTLQAELMVYFYPQRHSIDSSHISAIIAAQEKRIADIFALLDAQLENQTFLVGEQLSVCDFYLFMLAVWADELKRPPLSFEYLGSYLRRLAKRKAIIKVCNKENLSLTDYQ